MIEFAAFVFLIPVFLGLAYIAILAVIGAWALFIGLIASPFLLIAKSISLIASFHPFGNRRWNSLRSGKIS